MTTLAIPDECALGPEDCEHLARIAASLPLLADLSRADILVYVGAGIGPATVVAQARPHSVSPILRDALVGQRVTEGDNPLLFRALRRGRAAYDTLEITDRAIPTFQEVHPVRSHDGGQIVGALGLVTNLLEYERHRRRNPIFQQALEHLQQMALQGDLCQAINLSLFGEHDGIMVVDAAGVIRYVSGIATNLYRKIGHGENLVDTAIAGLPADAALFQQALDTGQCLEEESEEEGFIWVKKAIPVREEASGVGRLLGRLWSPTAADNGYWGVMLTIHDATETRRKERELRIKSALIQEIHHRVKNNLQTIAALLRLQARRSESDEVQHILQTTINRILSIAMVHEFLAQGEGTPINIRDLARQVVHQLIRSTVDPEQQIQLNWFSDDIFLPAQQATACALVVNELIQNALEHGFVDQDSGIVVVHLRDQGAAVGVDVWDNGVALPPNFDVQRDGSLGLRIVQTLVAEDLKGSLQLYNDDDGVRAVVSFPQAPLDEPASPLGEF